MAKCPYIKEPTDPIEKWDAARVGKPISEWPPLPKELTLIKYDNGIILTSVDGLKKFLKESGWRCDK